MRRLLPILLALCAMLHAIPALASARLVASHEQVHAGQQVTLEWTGLSAQAEEVELECSLDGGRWVRISPELEADEHRFVWNVPTGHGGRARVRLRAGERRDEQVVATTELEILAASDLAPRRVGADDDWWNLAADSHVPFGDRVGREQAEFVTFSTPPAVAPSSPVFTAASSAGIRGGFSRRRCVAAPAARARQFCAPRSIPLRN